jgi:hypothetical protein
MIETRLEVGLVRLAELMAGASEPWWIIGSTAMVLAGVVGVMPDDIDVVADGKMLQRILQDANINVVEPLPHAKFRSMPYSRIKVVGGADIEFQGDLDLRENGQWQRLLIASRVQISVGEAVVFVPSLDEQLRILRRFGREKDLAKAALLEVFMAQTPA